MAALAGSLHQELAVHALVRAMGAPDMSITQQYDALYRQAADLVPDKQGAARAETVRTLLYIRRVRRCVRFTRWPPNAG